jgi:polysaccharide deacetylase 2 family uncharacterized protein YibQ
MPSEHKKKPAARKKKHMTSTSKRVSSSSRKRPAKKKKKRAFFSRRWVKTVLFTVIALGLVGIGYCLGSCWNQEQKPHVSKHHVVSKKTHTHPNVTHKPKQITSHVKPVHKHPKTVSEQEKKPLATNSVRLSRVRLAYRGSRPKLAIIIDDVHTRAQLRAIMALGMPVTPSIFPPYTLSPHTNTLATFAPHYMIHLPMESGNAKFNRQSKTLMTTASSAQMTARIHELRRLFPRARFINNHTGSVFTGNYRAMDTLYRAMRKEGFIFIDSKTTGKSKVRQIARHYGDAYVARDVFIDNIQEVGYIHGQLAKAVALAKKHGYAIAIGHPHEATLKALQSAKGLLKEVEVVYIDSLFREE